MKRVFASLFLLLISLQVMAQRHQPSAAQIKLQLKKLNVLGAVLYVAAHPDDENTRVIAYLANERLSATAYLSMTRGDGGQNLIGPEIRDLLGLIRTQELLAARRIDGGEQFFTRANDFGFSKNYQETFATWNKEEILSDVVRVIRMYQPDVIITRFPPDERAGHGHHTASAILAQEAFDEAAKADRFAEQRLQPWQTKRIFTNTGRWWNNTINESTPGIITLNVGAYNHLLGQSYAEMAAASRTQHKSQGFGSPGRRGDAPEYFEFVKGEKAERDIFDGINTTWARVKGGDKIQPLVATAIREFDEEQPARLIPRLLEIRTAIEALSPSVWKNRKLKEVNQLLQDCAGLFVEAVATQASAAPGEEAVLNIEVVNRGGAAATLQSVSSSLLSYDSTLQLPLGSNRLITFKSRKRVLPTAMYSSPYWLQAEHPPGLFTVPDVALIGKPENDPAISLQMDFVIEGQPLPISVPVIHKWTDPVKGELWRPFEITPPVSVSLSAGVYVFPDLQPRKVTVLAKSYAAGSQRGEVKLMLPSGYRSEPASAQFELTKRGEERSFDFMVYPSAGESTAAITAVAQIGNQQFDRSVQVINYDHIPAQTLTPPASAKAVRLELKKSGALIGYVKGAGDEVPVALRNMGYEVWEMKNEEITRENLQRLDAVVLGVRALNTNERIRYNMPLLHDYVKEGGTVVVQYNTNFDLEIEADKVAPYSLKLSRDRVTEENSAVNILNPNHPLLSYPNKITDRDFQGWVQERGLYFPGEWSAEFEPLLAMKDGNEPERKGSLLVARYGRGSFVYTGLSFFRQLPEGVPGAYRLFANMVSQSKQSNPPSSKNKSSKR